MRRMMDGVQLSLNDDTEYEGGRIHFYTPRLGLVVPKKCAGDVTIHAANTLHCVSRLMSGKRYALFVVDENNGKIGDKNVHVGSDLLPPVDLAATLRGTVPVTKGVKGDGTVEPGGDAGYEGSGVPDGSPAFTEGATPARKKAKK